MMPLDKETEAWLAIRKEAAKAINPATAVVFWVNGQVGDPYGIMPDIPDEARRIGPTYFARAPGSDMWVSFHDLPASVVNELRKGFERNPPMTLYEMLDGIIRDYGQKIRALAEQNSHLVDRAACIFGFNAACVREYREAHPAMMPQLMLTITTLTQTAISWPELLEDETAPVMR